MKDFYDLWFLSRSWPFQMIALSDTIRATFERRGTPLPVTAPLALMPGFHTERVGTFQSDHRVSPAPKRLPLSN
jgi:hypothetical protein